MLPSNSFETGAGVLPGPLHEPAALPAEALQGRRRDEPSIHIDGSDHHVVVVAAPAGAGKSYFCATAIGELCAAFPGTPNLALVCTPTNDQAWDLAGNLARRLPGERIALMPASSSKARPPEALTALPNVVVVDAAGAAGERVVVSTLDKAADAHGRASLSARFRFLLVDESYQASSAQYFGVGGLADRHLLVGEPGQIAPFTTMADADRWRGLPEDPVASAVGVLLRHHPNVPVHRLPITRRLPPSAVPLCSAFYPDHRFGAWVTESARRLDLAAGRTRGTDALVDRAADLAATTGWAWVRLPEQAVLSADPDTIEVITRLVARVLDRAPMLASELTPEPVALTPRASPCRCRTTTRRTCCGSASTARGSWTCGSTRPTSSRASSTTSRWRGTLWQGYPRPTASTSSRAACA